MDVQQERIQKLMYCSNYEDVPKWMRLSDQRNGAAYVRDLTKYLVEISSRFKGGMN